ncbi:hypothetical protein [Streptomyces phaeochromogenes]|uniref:hypothetical protein n=1 Tax=Streptomyces phaeochromogenes TaxID=1923 RepID=UPI0033EAADAA|nr:hypothetical protein OG277_47225 [Streptomyces phaeochromogenes]
MQHRHVQHFQRIGLDIRILVQELTQANRRVVRRPIGMFQRSPVGVLDQGTRIR